MEQPTHVNIDGDILLYAVGFAAQRTVWIVDGKTFDDKGELAEYIEKYNIEDEATASHMLETVKRRFKNVLKEQVRQTVLTGQVVEEELKEILKFLEK